MANKSVGLLTIAFGANTKGFDRAMKKTQRSLKKFGRQMESIGRNLTTKITLPVIGLGAASVKMASDFNESLNKVRVSFGEASQDVEKFAKFSGLGDDQDLKESKEQVQSCICIALIVTLSIDFFISVINHNGYII